MNQREIEKKRRDAAYQRLTVADFDQLIELVNKIRSVTQMNGDLDHLEPGGHTSHNCPLYQTVHYKPSAFGKGWDVEVEGILRVMRIATGTVIKRRWPELWNLATAEAGGVGLDLEHADGYQVEIEPFDWHGGLRGEYEIKFTWTDEVISNFVGAFDDGEEARYLDVNLAEEELVELLA